jgi:hypothetical protein
MQLGIYVIPSHQWPQYSIGLRPVNLRFAALPSGRPQETGDSRFIVDLSFCHNVNHIPHVGDRDSSRETIGLDQIRPLGASSGFVLNSTNRLLPDQPL